MTDGPPRIVREARRFWGREAHRQVNWEAVDRGLFERIEGELRSEQQALTRRPSRGWLAAAGLLAAAGVAAILAKTGRGHSFDVEHPSADEEAATIAAIDGPGEVTLDDRRVAIGTALHVGDTLRTHATQVTIGRTGKLTLVLERDSTASVTHVRGALVLALSQGAIEAQVVPVSRGEAFAVDVGPSRVAAHGTHLRVARVDDRVVVDLSDGVISLGSAPRIGPTIGALVAAPAHAEFSDSDAEGTLEVTHELGALRPAVSLTPPALFKPQPAIDAPPSPRPDSPAVASAPIAPGFVRPEHPELRAVAPAVTTATVPAAPPPDPNAAQTIAAAVRGCMADRLHPDDVSIVVSTTLSLGLRDDGSVRSARFDPPVAPDVNGCVAKTIYKTRFTHGGDVTVPVSFKN